MAPTWWGLNLGEIQWSKFNNKYMWNKVYHLRRTKFIVYQIAMIFCVVSESLGTDVLSDYVKQQKQIAKIGNPEIYEYNDDYVGIASYNIFAGIYIAFIFGGAFFFDLIWPERREDKGVRIAWKVCSFMTGPAILASAIAMTYIVADRSAYIHDPTGNGQSLAEALRAEGRYPLQYNHNARAIASLCFLWPGWVACIASTVIMWKSIDYTEKYGPWTKSERAARGLNGSQDLTLPSMTGTVEAQEGGEAKFDDWNQKKLNDPNRGGGPSERPGAGERTYTGT